MRLTIPLEIVFIILYSLPLLSACQVSVEQEEPYFDKDIPPSEDYDAANGVWSPDGTKIAYQYDAPLGDEPDPGKLDQLWVYDRETKERRKVIGGRVLNIDWSPDGEWFVFHIKADRPFIMKVRSDGTELTKLTGQDTPSNLEYTNFGRWSPDGSKIIFSVFAGEPRGVSLMNPDGTEAQIMIPYGVGANWFPGGRGLRMPTGIQRLLTFTSADSSIQPIRMARESRS